MNRRYQSRYYFYTVGEPEIFKTGKKHFTLKFDRIVSDKSVEHARDQLV